MNSPDVVGLARRTNGELWVALADSSIYLAASGSQTLRPLANLPSIPTTRTQVTGLAVTPTEVFISKAGSVHHCTGTCASHNDFTVATSVGGLETTVALCARDARVFMLSQSGSTSSLWEYQGGTFTKTVADVGVAHGMGCFIAENGDVLVVGDDSNVAVLTSNGGLNNEPIDLGAHPGASWRSVTTSATGGFLVGGGSGYRFATRQAGHWVDLAPNTAGAVMTTVLAAGADVYAGGFTNTGSTATPAFFKWNGTSFVALSPPPFAIDVTDGLAVSANELYFGGPSRTSGSYEVLHGTR